MTTSAPTILERIGASKVSRGERERINRLADMDRRHTQYLKERNRAALIELAAEYQCIGRYGMPVTAAQVKAEAERL